MFCRPTKNGQSFAVGDVLILLGYGKEHEIVEYIDGGRFQITYFNKIKNTSWEEDADDRLFATSSFRRRL